MIIRKTIIGYAMSFASFLVDSSMGDKIDSIILFGSVARGDFTKESDIDIFIDCSKNLEGESKKILNLFKSSQTYRLWQLRGIKNDISLKLGILKEWKLRREVISSGIMLYGKYSELPENAKYYALIHIKGISEKKTSEQMKIFRRLYGYTQKIGKKKYLSRGIVGDIGMKLGRGTFIVPMERRHELLSFLKKNQVSYHIYELWSDAFENVK